jgi:tetratricopeptide (TPR) repeat protein
MPPRVEYDGCARVERGPVCVLPESGEIVLWVADTEGAHILLDGTPVTTSAETVAGGRRFRIDVGGASRLAVEWHGQTAFDLELQPDGDSWRQEAVRLFWAGELETLRQHMEERLEGSPAGRAFALGQLARLALRANDLDRARDLFEQALVADRAHGHLSDEIEHATAFAYLLIYRRYDLAAAGDLLDALPRGPEVPGERAYDVDYLRGLLAFQAGDLRHGLRHTEAAAARGERIDLPFPRLSAALQMLAQKLQTVGRSEDSRRVAEDLRRRMPETLHPCLGVQIGNALAWVELLRLEAGEQADDPAPGLATTLALLRDGCPQLPQEEINLLLNLALAHLHFGRTVEARAALDEVVELLPGGDYRFQPWYHLLRGRLELAAGHPEQALQAFDTAARRAALGLAPEMRWRAELGRARTLFALGRGQDLEQSLEDAESLLERAAFLVALGEGRTTFLARHGAAAQLHLEHLLADGRHREAFEVARRARARVLRGLDRQERIAHLEGEALARWRDAMGAYHRERDRLDRLADTAWQLPEDRRRRLTVEREDSERDLLRRLDQAFASPAGQDGPLPEPPAGTLTLLYFPSSSAWFGFAADGATLHAARLECDPATTAGPELAHCLFDPFAGPLDSTRDLRFLPYGPLRQVDLHALPWGGEPLAVRHSVAYSLDLPAPPAAADGALRALVVSDPLEDLPAARREAEGVLEVLTAAGSAPVHLAGQAASGPAVRQGLTGIDLLHYAGHALFAGTGWESALPLAGGTRLTAGDILALPSVPRTVVLSGCETGRTAAVEVESMGLAHAFLAAGAHRVLAAVRPVDDTTAARLSVSFYHHWLDTGDAVEALRRAQGELRAEEPTADWSAFRLLLP